MTPTLLEQFDTTVWPNRYRFLAVFVVVLLSTYGALVAVDFVPEPVADTEPSTDTAIAASETEAETSADDDPTGVGSTPAGDQTSTAATDTTAVAPQNAKPVRLVIDALEREMSVHNPTSRRVADLDAALRSGAVRHPDSADFAREGTIFVLGHSSHLPNVMNHNYQAFNGIETLQWGDTIRLYSNDTEYIYRVDRVYEAKASEATVPIAGTGPRLTLATCDSFGSIDDRFIVEAELRSSRPLSS